MDDTTVLFSQHYLGSTVCLSASPIIELCLKEGLIAYILHLSFKGFENEAVRSFCVDNWGIQTH